MSSKIIHIDADCFYAAVEMRDDASLAGIPMAVGGSSERRGVLSTCNYEARAFGLHSAMSSAQALKLCPSLLIVPVRMQAYREASAQMREIFADYTDLIEPLSLDEAYLDVSACTKHQGSATLIAEEIRQRILDTVNITVSAGVAPNKFLAKVASDWHKPNGLTVIPPQRVDSFVKQLPVNKIHGVGKVTSDKLKRLGIRTCDDVRQYDLFELCEHLGSFAKRLHELAHGIDERKVKANRERKSLSVERTFAEDINNGDSCLNKLPVLITELQQRLTKNAKDKRIKNAFVKVKFSNFSSTTLELAGSQAQLNDYRHMLKKALLRCDSRVRLLGIGVRFQAEPDNSQQLELFR